jgi:LemA protein
VERRRYNELLREYIVSIRRFPQRVFATLFGSETREFFQAAPGAQEVPRVDFGPGQ